MKISRTLQQTCLYSMPSYSKNCSWRSSRRTVPTGSAVLRFEHTQQEKQNKIVGSLDSKSTAFRGANVRNHILRRTSKHDTAVTSHAAKANIRSTLATAATHPSAITRERNTPAATATQMKSTCVRGVRPKRPRPATSLPRKHKNPSSHSQNRRGAFV